MTELMRDAHPMDAAPPPPSEHAPQQSPLEAPIDKLVLTGVDVVLPYGHTYTWATTVRKGQDNIGHNCTCHSNIGQHYIGHDYIGHGEIGHDYI